MRLALQPFDTIWRLRLFDGLQLEDAAGNKVHRFRSQRTGALLAYLALHLGRACSREELCEALWPEEDLLITSNRLRVTLASLRRQMEPAGTPFGAVLDVSEPGCIRLRSETVWCDAVEFDRLWKAGKRDQAKRLIQGDLLPGFYDEWILAERNRFMLLQEQWEDTTLPTDPSDASPSHPPTSNASTAPPESTPFSPRPPTLQKRLPPYLTRFFGREAERERLHELILSHRLVTLTGAGGIGKTRLAVETARQMPLPCVFVPLADLPDMERLPEATLQSLLILPQPNVDPVEQLITVLQTRDPLLLILDNAEHLVASVSAFALRLLAVLPELHLLVTSRQRLELPGEVILALLPLEPPPHASVPERLAEFPAVALFLDRAQAARPDFTLSPRHTDAVVQICLRLEGMPLALELAAARVTAQTPTEISAGLETGLMELKSRQRGLSERHRSLRAAIQGSYDLLPPDLQTFFRALSAFQGGWMREAARAVTGSEEAETYLEELILRSLVTTRENESGKSIRFFFLETLRQFAAEQLSENERKILRERHAGYFLTLAASVWEEDIRTFFPLDAEQENLLAALDYGRKESGHRFWNALTGALTHAFVRGLHHLALNWVEEALANVATLPDANLRFRLRRAAVLILQDVGRVDEALQIIGEGEADLGADDKIEATFCLAGRGYLLYLKGDLAGSQAILRDALRQARLLQDSFLMTRCLSLLTSTLAQFGAELGRDSESGSAMLREAETLGRELIALLPATSSLLSSAWYVLFLVLNSQQKYGEAYTILKESQRLAADHRKLPVLMFTLFHESILGHRYGWEEYAALRLGGFLELREHIGYSPGKTHTRLLEEIYDRLRDSLGAEYFDLLLRRGRQTPVEVFLAEQLPSRLKPVAFSIG